MHSTRKRRYFLDYLKAFACIFVVLHHAIGFAHQEGANIFVHVFYYMITNVHVPMFFCVAGYLCHQQKLKPYFTKKVFRILIPFIVFSALKIFYSTFISSEYAHATGIPSQLFDAFILGRLYWFAYAILILFAVAPLLWKMKRGNIILFLGLIVVNAILHFTKIQLTEILQFGKTLSHACFFVAGIILQQNEESISKFIQRYKVLIFVICFAIMCAIPTLRFINQDLVTKTMSTAFTFSMMYILYLIAKQLPAKCTVLECIGKYSLQIMFLDSFFRVVLFAVIPPTSPIIAILIAILVIPLCCFTCIIAEKIPYVRRLFGL